MNLTREYRTVRAIFEEPPGVPGPYDQISGPEDDDDDIDDDEQQFQTHFRVGPIVYYVELNKVEELCYVNFGYFDMVGTTQELIQHFSRLYKREIDDVELARLKDRFERRPNGILRLGNAGKVFGHVLAILRDFKSKYDFSCLKFSSYDESRTDLYRRMVKSFLPDWEMEENPSGDMVWFTACEPGTYWAFS